MQSILIKHSLIKRNLTTQLFQFSTQAPRRISMKMMKKNSNSSNKAVTLGHVPLSSPLDKHNYTNGTSDFSQYIAKRSSGNTKRAIKLENKYLCNNYGPLPVIIKESEGIYLKDIDNKTFIDFLAGYSALNQGHGNKNIINALVSQANTLYMTSRAFYNNILGRTSQFICNKLGYERILFMNSGAEAGESAIKIARKWSYEKKGLRDNSAKVIFCNKNFWGRSLYACNTSDDKGRYDKFGPFLKNSHYMIDFNNISQLEKVLTSDPNICAFFLEAIQAEGGVNIPDNDYLSQVRELCTKHNVLMIVDEIQTGLGRTGNTLCCDMYGVKPDIVLLGKSLSGGIYPVSAVLTSGEVMDVIKPGDHGSTYGGNPLAANVATAAVKELFSKKLPDKSRLRGIQLGGLLERGLRKNKCIKEVRGRGLLFCIELHEDIGWSAYDLSIWLMERGILCKPTRINILRLTPPLTITSEQIKTASNVITTVLNNLPELVKKDKLEGKDYPTFNIVKKEKTLSRNASTRKRSSNNSKEVSSDEQLDVVNNLKGIHEENSRI